MVDTPHVRTETTETLVGTSEPPSPATNDIIPPKHAYRTLVLCFDGTGDQFDADNSNIVEFFRLLKKDDSTKQMVYYQAGIGTYTSPDIATPFMAKVEKTLDEAIAWNLHAHVMGGYEFIMQNYLAGDRICIFGFSRGAYTARSLAGMIHKVGVLPAGNFQQVPFAYSMYTREDEVGWQQSNGFKKAFAIDVDIEFLGVWDTVSSVGLIPRRLPFTTSNTIVRTFRHAVSLDEHRAKFKPSLWGRADPPKTPGTASAAATDATYVHPVENSVSSVKKKKNLRSYERLYDSYDADMLHPAQSTNVEEVWFAGCHCDVGGGSVSNDTKPNLARIPLRWMIRECFRTNSGIMFHSELLKHVGLDPDALYPEVKPRPPALPVGQNRIQRIPKKSWFAKSKKPSAVPAQQPQQTEEEMELADALSPIYDQLSLAWGWWVLEFWPIRMWSHKKNSWFSWMKYGWNLGRGRIIPKHKQEQVKVHRSVKLRLEAVYDNNARYVPKASGFDEGNTVWVD